MLSKYSKEQLHAAAEALKAYKEKPFVCHEWQELVSRLCHSSDPQLREKMQQEMKAIMEIDPHFKNFEMM
jgi:hypothetical protein